jgi:hypothetical protein
LHTTKTYGGMEVKLLSFLTWVLEGGEWSVFAARPLYLR